MCFALDIKLWDSTNIFNYFLTLRIITGIGEKVLYLNNAEHVVVIWVLGVLFESTCSNCI